MKPRLEDNGPCPGEQKARACGRLAARHRVTCWKKNPLQHGAKQIGKKERNTKQSRFSCMLVTHTKPGVVRVDEKLEMSPHIKKICMCVCVSTSVCLFSRTQQRPSGALCSQREDAFGMKQPASVLQSVGVGQAHQVAAGVSGRACIQHR